MHIGVVSDTHMVISSIERLVKEITGVDVLIHLGDNVADVATIKKYYKGEIINVKGNCDFSESVPIDRLVEVGGKKIFLTHGHIYGVKENLSVLRYKALETGADIVLYGHTHVAKIDFEEGIWYINPGSASLPRDGERSYAIININQGNVEPKVIRF
ncbi:metallophosphoesterase [Clostridium sp.]|uniref:metallophosphoesterase n=1 Tax=Clostridium sp. TaxID=1506 RepID=UPI0026061FA7|nr:metallophosphoesterase [uncultured Clostridium sp.]